MPGVGITYFLRHLESRSKDNIVSINTYEMPEFTKEAFYKQMILKLGGVPKTEIHDNIQYAKELLHKNLQSHKRKTILVFNRLDRLSKIFDQTMLDNLKFLRDQDRTRLVMIFVSSGQLVESKALELKEVLSVIAKTQYFPPYSSADLKEILEQDTTHIIEQSAVTLSGGHHNLYNVLTRCQNLDNALSDSMVELLIKDMYFSLDRKKRDDLEKVAKRKKDTADEFLVGVGYVKQVGSHLETFSPLLSEYIIEETSSILPVMEQRLYDVLKKYKNTVVPKETIFDEVWKEQDGIASEWSLNSLMYRLRNHPGFDKNRFAIKSAKKVGYVMYDSFDD
ncbi:winged helix-turn-helix domain-containing protein [Candidatus Saccharibacteria bacterium]|nr:winged helix-turn-helix domain-containing protein [Candidatus Saccharibacteria bacterium]